MKTRNRWQILAVMACAVLLAAPAIAGDDGQGGGERSGVCVLDGAWLGDFSAWNMSGLVIFDSDSHWTGRIWLQFIGWDPSLAGLGMDLPATAFSSTTGTWVRTGRRTFDYTIIGYGLDADGVPVYIVTNVGSIELSANCDEYQVTSETLALYLPTQDPFGDEPPGIACISDGSVGTARRIPVVPPCEP